MEELSEEELEEPEEPAEELEDDEEPAEAEELELELAEAEEELELASPPVCPDTLTRPPELEAAAEELWEPPATT